MRTPARIVPAILWLVSAGAAHADFQIGYVTSFDGRETITDDEIPRLADLYFQDGDPRDGVVRSKSVIIQTQCYAGDHLDNYDDTRPLFPRSLFDSARFTNATMIAGNPPGKLTTYHFLCDLMKRAHPSLNAGQLFARTNECRELRVDHDLQFQGNGTERLRGDSSTHVLVWASQPDAKYDVPAMQRIAQLYPPTPDNKTTVTVLAGDGTAAQTGAQAPGVVYRSATRANLEDAMQEIGERMDDGPDELFILFVIDHGGKARVDTTDFPLRIIPVAAPPTPGSRSVVVQPTQPMLASIRENASTCDPAANPACEPHLSLVTPQQPGLEFAPSDLQVNLTRPGASPFPLGSAAGAQVFPADLGDAIPRYELRFPLSQEALFGSAAMMLPREGIPYTIELQNWSTDTAIGVDVVGIYTGSIPPNEPDPRDYPGLICGNDPDLGCSEPSAYFRLDEPQGTGTGFQPIMDYVLAGSDPADGFYGDLSHLGAEGPRSGGFSNDNLAVDCDVADVLRIQRVIAELPRTELSVTGMVAPDGLAAGEIIGQADDSGTHRPFSLGTDGSGQLGFRVFQNQSPLHQAAIWSPEPLSPGSWSQVTASIGDGTMRLCVDGREVARRDFGVPTEVPDDLPLWICRGFDGRVDELALHPRAFDVGECEKLADEALGPLTGAFGFPVIGLNGVQVRRASPHGIWVGPFNDQGNGAASFDVRSADVGTQGFNLRIRAADLLNAGTSAFIGAGGKRLSTPTFFGYAGVQSVGLGQAFVVADFSSLGDPGVVTEVFDEGVPTGGFTGSAGAVVSLPVGAIEEVGVLPGPNWGYRIRFKNAVPITRVGATSSVPGNELHLSAPGVVRGELEVSNVDLIGFDLNGMKVLDAVAGMLPEILPGDLDRDGQFSEWEQIALLGQLGRRRANAYENGNVLDFNGDDVISVADGRVGFSLLDAIGPPTSPALLPAPEGGALGDPPLLSLQPSSPVVQSGDPLALGVVISDLTGTVIMGGFSLEVRYDPLAFALDGVSFGGALGSIDPLLDHAFDPAAQTAMFAFDTPGVVQLYVISKLDEAQLAALQQSGTSTLATLSFTARAPIPAQFALAAVDMVDGAQPPLPLEPVLQGAPVEVACALDSDGDSICDDGDGSAVAGDRPCTGAATVGCDDNCPGLANPLQEDGEGDAIGDVCDPCPFYASTDLSDTDGDGRGDVCECTDQDGDGRNTVSDLVAINLAIFDPGRVTALCDGNNDGLCNVSDILAANVEIFSPTNTSTCERQPVPGP